MSLIDLPIGDPDAAVAFSTTLFQQVQTEQNWLNLLSGPAPQVGADMPTAQSPGGYPVVKVIDLMKGSSDTVQTTLINQVHGKPVVGDTVLAGKFMKTEASRLYTRVNQLRGGVAVEKGAQRRTVHDLRLMGQKGLGEWVSRVTDQRAFVTLAGARGYQNIPDWEIPLAADPDFGSIMVNALNAPTYNRRYVKNGGAVVPGGTVASIAVTDILNLDDVTDVISHLQTSIAPLAPVKIENDEYDWFATHVLFVPIAVWNIMKRASATRKWDTALQSTIARLGTNGSRKHPLFTGEQIVWNNVLIKPMDRYQILFGPASIVVEDTGSTGTYTASNVTVPNTSTNFYVGRSILLGAQALIQAFGSEGQDSYIWRWNEEYADHKNSIEISVSMVDGFQKTRFKVAGYDTDIGVAVIDSYAPPIGTAQYATAMAL